MKAFQPVQLGAEASGVPEWMQLAHFNLLIVVRIFANGLARKKEFAPGELNQRT